MKYALHWAALVRRQYWTDLSDRSRKFAELILADQKLEVTTNLEHVLSSVWLLAGKCEIVFSINTNKRGIIGRSRQLKTPLKKLISSPLGTKNL
jgi:hypothetical protein